MIGSRLPPGRLRRIAGLMRKESLQILRDPSSYLIAVVLPILLLLIFGFGVSLDVRSVAIGVVLEQATPEADSLLASFRNSRYFAVRVVRHRAEVEPELVAGRLRGILVIPADFAERLARNDPAPVQVLVDGSDPNTAGLVQGYAQGVWANWLEQEREALAAAVTRRTPAVSIDVEPRYWYNAELRSPVSLLPGAVAINLTLVGTMLTALVIAREWERGTMEALLATPVSPGEFLIGKIVPYFVLGLTATALSVAAAVWLFDVPFRGSILVLLLVASAYLATMLTLGLLISTVTRNQFLASQVALVVGFLPAFELSGFIFEIDSMPAPIRLLTQVLPPRYFVESLRTLFLAGDVAAILVPNTAILAGFATVLLVLLVRATRARLE